jgi:hypothetical protein
MRIIFHSNILLERGVCVVIYDYALYARKYLNLHPIIVYNLTLNNLQSSVERFKNEFEVFGYEKFEEVQKIVDRKNIEYFYAQKYGYDDNIICKNCKNLIHSVFCSDEQNIHGDKYAVISEWMTQKSHYKIPFVPYMINLPEVDYDFRKKFNIPEDSIVIGRYGGKETFNIEFVIYSIMEILEKRNDIWFLFLNTEPKIQHKRCIYINDPIVDLNEKVQFINTCDVFLHARDYGETFGASVLEFASKNKQIISYDNFELQNNHPLGGRNHFLYLGDNCFKYTNKDDLDKILLNITKDNPFNTLYLNKQFSPQSVIKQFETIFLQ